MRTSDLLAQVYLQILYFVVSSLALFYLLNRLFNRDYSLRIYGWAWTLLRYGLFCYFLPTWILAERPVGIRTALWLFWRANKAGLTARAQLIGWSVGIKVTIVVISYRMRSRFNNQTVIVKPELQNILLCVNDFIESLLTVIFKLLL